MRKTARLSVVAGGLMALLLGAPLAVQAEGHSEAYAGSKGYVGAKGYVAPTARTARPVADKPYVRGQSFGSFYTTPKHLRVWTVPVCPANYNGLYRGTLYCVNGQPMH